MADEDRTENLSLTEAMLQKKQTAAREWVAGDVGNGTLAGFDSYWQKVETAELVSLHATPPAPPAPPAPQIRDMTPAQWKQHKLDNGIRS